MKNLPKFLLLGILLAGRAMAVTCVMEPVTGTDGPFDPISMDGRTLYQAHAEAPGKYSGLMYFKRPAGIQFSPGATLYMEVDYKDIGGSGRFSAHYNSVYNDFQSSKFFFNSSVKNSATYKTAVFKLDSAKLHFGQNGGSDLRLAQDGLLQMHIAQVRLSDQPSPLIQKYTAYLLPYAGPSYAGVDASSFSGKVIAGYQGWFRTPGDDGDVGWQHFIPDWGGQMHPSKIAMDMWPDMTEFSPAEQHIATGFTYPDGRQATLFSSNSFRTVLRHFQWMEAWGLDGVAIQRNADDLESPDSEILRNTAYVRNAANLTGRVFYIEYALRIPTRDQDLAPLAKDWHSLVDSMKLTKDARYLQQGGLPVVGIYGFAMSSLSPEIANKILDIFQAPGPYQAFVAGAGPWPWRTTFSADWKKVVYRMGSWQPWNVGHTKGHGQEAITDFWGADQAELHAHHVLYQPMIYPGGSADNRGHLSRRASLDARSRGRFMWQQFATATRNRADSIFIAMFDELDEGTEIFKVTNHPPTQAYFIGYEGLPSDAYLCFSSQGTKMFRREIPFSASKPDCAAMTQPTIPDPLAPLHGAALPAGRLNYSWNAALALEGGGTIKGYEVLLDGVTHSAQGQSLALNTAAGRHVWRVRAVNSLGNAGGWSVPRIFTVAQK